MLTAPSGQAQGLVDHGWSGHPVSFALPGDEARAFVACYDAARRLTVANREVAGAEWTFMQPARVPVSARGRDSNVTGWDGHNFLRFARDRDGHLHLADNMHNDPLVYHRTHDAGDITTLDFVHGGRRWVLRWETLPRNRDRPRDIAPPPTELRLHEFPDMDVSRAAHVGS